MTLKTTGKFLINSMVCEKCDCNISLSCLQEIPDNVRCPGCGANYKLSNRDENEEGIILEFDFSGFKCMHKEPFTCCDNDCPVQNMYCLEHTSDEAFENERKTIAYLEERLSERKSYLNKMEESKKIWLIQELSGVDDE